MIPQEKALKSLARSLRKDMTDAESALWYRLRRKQILDLQFYRQKVIGAYIVDFYCPAANLVIEVDGGQHSDRDEQSRDQNRDAYMASLGLRVLRFSNLDVLNRTEDVLEKVYEHLIQPEQNGRYHPRKT